MSSNKLDNVSVLEVFETKTQRQLVSLLIKHGEISIAAKEMGISVARAKDITRSGGYLRLFRDAYVLELTTVMAPMALKVISGMVTGTVKSEKVRADLCKTVLDRIGVSAMKPTAQDDGSRPTEEMSIKELEDFVNRKKLELSDGAKIIEHNAPTITLDNSQAIDYLD